MSWQSSLEWYRLANERVRDRLGGHHSARILLDSLDFAEIEAMQARDDWDAAGNLLASRALALESAGAELLVLCTNTMHLVADRIQDAASIPLLHIVDVTAEAILRSGVRTVGLLGTAFTIILGCTEIELLISADDAPVPVYPTTSLHVDAALAAALED